MRFAHPAIPIVLAAVLIDTIGFGIVLPVLPQLIVELGDVSLTEATRIAGYMLVVYALMHFFAGPVIGRLGDRFGRRPVMIVALAAFSIDYALMAGAPTIGWLFLGRAIAGIAGAVYAPASAVIADTSPPERRSQSYGYLAAAFGLGFIIGPAIGGLLGELGPRAPFYAAAGFGAINALVIALFLPETLPPENRRPFSWRSANVFGAFAPLARHAVAIPLLVAWFLWQVAHQIYPAIWAFWTKLAFQWSEAAIGASLAFSGLLMATVQLVLTGRIVGRIGEPRAIALGLGCARSVSPPMPSSRPTGWSSSSWRLPRCRG